LIGLGYYYPAIVVLMFNMGYTIQYHGGLRSRELGQDHYISLEEYSDEPESEEDEPESEEYTTIIFHVLI
jgi:hypothetical protein